jgi:hypothetical protein
MSHMAIQNNVAFRWKDYRIGAPDRWKTMKLPVAEFIRRFLMHVLPKGFHRIRHYGLLANGNRAANLTQACKLLAVPAPVKEPKPESTNTEQPDVHPCPCPRCGGRMLIIEVFARGSQPKYQVAAIRIDTS